MPAVTTILAAAAVAGGIYQGIQANSAARQASHMQAPPPASYYTYDENGMLAGSQVWNAKKNAYEYHAAQLTPEQATEKAARQKLRTEMLGNLDMSSEELMAKYSDYANKLVETDYKKTVSGAEEQMNARGLTGSRAYADRLAEIDKLKTDTVLNTETGLMQADRSQWLNVLGTLDAGESAATGRALEAERTAEAGAAGASSYLMQDFQNRQAAAFANVNAQNQFGTNLMNTATGLMYLYGYKSGGLGGNAPTPPTISGGGGSGNYMPQYRF
jgi:hypothetical protein